MVMTAWGMAAPTNNRSDGATRATGVCLKYVGSAQQRVRECPLVQPDEADCLLKELRASRNTAIFRVVNGSSPREARNETCEGDRTVQAVAGGPVVRALLLDTGADESFTGR